MNLGGLWGVRSGREKALIVLGVVVIIVAAYLMMAPQTGYKQGMLSSAVARKQCEEAMRKKQEADAAIAALKPKLDTVAYRETSERVIPTVLNTLQQHAAKAGVHLREVKPLRPRQVGGATKVTLTVRFSSVFSKVIPFVYYVEDPQGKLVVEKMNISSPDPKSQQVDVEVQIALFTVEGSGAQEGKKG